MSRGWARRRDALARRRRRWKQQRRLTRPPRGIPMWVLFAPGLILPVSLLLDPGHFVVQVWGLIPLVLWAGWVIERERRASYGPPVLAAVVWFIGFFLAGGALISFARRLF